MWRAIVFMAVVAIPVKVGAAAELWSCYVSNSTIGAPLLVTHEVRGQEIFQRWSWGTEYRFRITDNNIFGLIGIHPIITGDAAQTNPTVGLAAVVLDKSRKEVWFSSIIVGGVPSSNAPLHGPCILRP
jgi:hypothetical protein